MTPLFQLPAVFLSHSSVAARPLRCPDWSFCEAQNLRKTAFPVPMGGLMYGTGSELKLTSGCHAWATEDKTPLVPCREHATTGLIRHRDLVLFFFLFGGPPAAGRQGVFVGSAEVYDACSLDCGWSLAIAGGAGDRSSLSRLSHPVPGPRGGKGSHLPYTSTGLLR